MKLLIMRHKPYIEFKFEEETYEFKIIFKNDDKTNKSFSDDDAKWFDIKMKISKSIKIMMIHVKYA